MAMSKSLNTSIDRFTSLPEDVAYKVLVVLSMEDISRLSVVSRRCRQLCISMPSLSVDVQPCLGNATKRTRLMNYVDRLLLLRRGIATHRFHITWCLHSSPIISGAEEEYRLLSWLHNAAICEVKELELILVTKRGTAFSLPPGLIRSMTLESLTVYHKHTYMDGMLKFPSYSSSIIGFSSLKSLTLSYVRIDESFGLWISSCCKCLEKLCLYWIKEMKSLIISSSSLEELDISSVDLCHLHVSAEILRGLTLWWEFDSPNNRTLQLSTPKLYFFCSKGRISNFPFKEDLASFKSAGRVLCPSYNSAFTLTSPRFILLYCDVCPVKYTDLLDHINQKPEDRESTKYCDAQNRTMIMPNLKFVTIELISQGKDEIEMINYLLKNARYLKMMTILYAPPLESDVIGGIRRHEKASYEAVVKFHPI
ncbi:F-box domain containing protein [Trema orientale]|uniref:F-box domain containing protein n=1 Tax=Trema orientale TaxID=63057 RepID=A0A2P5E687_TREOI|nr:F-box domain containing protein [Trema orientale]